MLQVIGIVVVLAVVYVIKAVAVMKSHESLAEQSTAFSWARMRAEDEATAAAWATEEETVTVSEPRVTLGTLRHAGGVRA